MARPSRTTGGIIDGSGSTSIDQAINIGTGLTNPTLVVGVVVYDSGSGSAITVSQHVYNTTETLTQIGSSVEESYAGGSRIVHASAWRLDNPTEGTTLHLAFTIDRTTDNFFVFWELYEHANNGIGPNVATSHGNLSAYDVSITSTDANGMLKWQSAYQAGRTITPGTGSSVTLGNNTVGDVGHAIEENATGGSDTIGGTLNSSVRSAVIAYELLPESAGGSGAIAGTSAGVAAASGTLVGTGALAGSASGVATDTATLAGTGALAGSSAGIASATATLAGTGSLAGSSVGIGAGSATLAGTGALAGSSAGIGAGSATLAGTGALAGTSAGIGAATGTVADAGGNLAGSSAGVGAGSATLAGTGALIGSSGGTGTASATLAGTGSLAGQADGVGSGAATLATVGEVRIESGFIGTYYEEWRGTRKTVAHREHEWHGR